MCNLYEPPSREKIIFRHLVPVFPGDWKPTVGPLQLGPIVLPGRAIVGQWGLIPPWSTTREPKTSAGKRMSTNNCRRETMATAPTFRGAWAKSQRCIIPAQSYDEPYWGTGKNIWWRFWRADGEPWALAGLWSEWVDRVTGEVVTNFTMITQNCDGHPLLGVMHKPDPWLPADKQDKRAVVPLEPEHWDQWLTGTPAQAEALIAVPPVAMFRHGAADPAKQVELPL